MEKRVIYGSTYDNAVFSLSKVPEFMSKLEIQMMYDKIFSNEENNTPDLSTYLRKLPGNERKHPILTAITEEKETLDYCLGLIVKSNKEFSEDNLSNLLRLEAGYVKNLLLIKAYRLYSLEFAYLSEDHTNLPIK